MSRIIATSSHTAQPMRGHGTYLGEGLRIGSPQPRLPNHQWVGPERPAVVIDNQATLVPQVLAERARRALWANCEQRPLTMDRIES